MNFTKLINQLNKVQQKNHQIDQKFMTTETFNKKYQNQTKIKLQLNNSQTKLSKTSIKQPKHRYYQDIKQDEIEDQNIFGFSFYQCLFSRKNKNVKNNEKYNLFATNKNQNKNLEVNKNLLSVPDTDQIKQKNQRLKTIIIQQRGVPTKRRIHHKLSLNQSQKTLMTQNQPSHSQTKQQFFNQTFFNFKSQEKQNIKKSSFCTGYRYSTPNIETKKSPSFDNKTLPSNFKKQQQNLVVNQTKNPLSFKNNFKEFYEKNKAIPNLKKKKKYSLDFQKIQQEKAKFNKDIQFHFNNLSKKDEKFSQNQGFQFSKSIVYEKKLKNNTKCQNFYENQKIQKEQQDNSKQQLIQKIENSWYLDGDNQDIEFNQIKLNKTVIKRVNFQTQLTQNLLITTQQILSKQKLTFDLSIIRSTNELFLQSHQLTQLQFKQNSGIKSNKIQSIIIQQIINRRTECKQFKDKSLKDFSSKSLKRIQSNKPQVYNLFLFVGSTLECLTLENIKISEEGIDHNGKLISIFLLCEKIFSKKTDFQFVHLLITRLPQNYKNQYSIPQQQQQDLVFQTFIHNSDVKFFQGREMEIQYFKYFLKRFITFDLQIQNKKQIEESLALIMESEVNIPVEFEQFCNDIDIKGDINIFAIKNQPQFSNEPSFKCLNINLSTLLINAHKSIQMIKKQLFEGYNWRGLSLKKQLQKNKVNQLQHFYI